MANCTVLITVKTNDTNVTEYECETQQGELLFYCVQVSSVC